MDAAPRNLGIENLTPPESVGSLIGFVNELTERTKLFEAASVPRTGLIAPHEGQFLGREIAEKYQVSVSTQVQWDTLRERYLIRVDDARDFTRWLVKWQQWRLNAMYGEEQATPMVLERVVRYREETAVVKEGPAPTEIQTLVRDTPSTPAPQTPLGYRKFRDPVEMEKEQQSEAQREESQKPEPPSKDYDSQVRTSLKKGNQAVWSANTVGGSAGAGYKVGASDAMAQTSQAPAGAFSGGGPSGMSPGPGRYRPPMTVVLQPGQTHLAQQNDFIVAMPGAQGAISQVMPAQSGGFGSAILGQVASRLPLGRMAGVAGAIAVPALGAAVAGPMQSLMGPTISPMRSFAPATPAPALQSITPQVIVPAPALPVGPQHGMMTIFAPPLRVSSPQAAAAGSAVEIPVSELTARSGPLDQAAISQLRASLPPGASLIYPALPNHELPPGASNVQLAPSLLGDVLGRAYGPAAAAMAPELASRGISARGPTPSEPIKGALVPEGRPAGSGRSILPETAGSQDLDAAGGGMASRGNALDFLGMPVRMAPSLGGRSELRDEIAARDGAQSHAQPTSAQPDKFATLRQRMFNGQPSMNVEPDQGQWERARPSFGMTSSSPSGILSPTSRVQPPSMTSPLPQIGSLASGAASGATPVSGAASFQPSLARSSSRSQDSASSPSLPTASAPSFGGNSSSPRSNFSSESAPTPSVARSAPSPIDIRFPTQAAPPQRLTSDQVHPILMNPAQREGPSRPDVSILPIMPAAAGGPMAVPSAPPSFPSSSPSLGFDGMYSAPSERPVAAPSKTARSAGSATGSSKSPGIPVSSAPISPRANPMAPLMSMAPLTTGMPIPRRTMSSPAPSPGAIQLSRPGESASSSGSGTQSSNSSGSSPRQGNTSGGPAQEVDMLAREVYSLIRRRLSVEAERRGR